MTTPTLEDVRRRLASPREADRREAAEDLAAHGVPEAALWLEERLGLESSRTVQEALVDALGSLGAPGVEPLLALLASSDAFLRNRAVAALRGLRQTSWLPLARAFSLTSGGERKLLLDALDVRPGDDAAVADEILAAALADPDPNVVITAVELLGRAERFRFRRQVEQLARQAEPMLAAACLEALLLIGNRETLPSVRAFAAQEGPLLPFWLALVARWGARDDLDEAAWQALARPAARQEAALETISEVLARDPGPLPPALARHLTELAHRAASQPLRSLAAALASAGRGVARP